MTKEKSTDDLPVKEVLGRGTIRAFFDIDGTLTEGLTIISFAKYLAQANVLDYGAWRFMQDDLVVYGKSDKGETAYERFAVDLVDHYAQGLAGRDVATVHQEAEHFFAQTLRGEVNGYKLCDFTPELVSAMNAIGKSVAISGSPRESLLPLQRFLNIDELQATTIAESKGVFTGKVITNMALASAKEQAVMQHSASGFNSRKSFAFGDTMHDVPLLQSVGNPFVLGNNPHLQAHGRERGWSVITEPSHVIPAVRKKISLVFGTK